MEVLLNKKTDTEATLSVKITAEDYKTKVEKTLKDYSRKMNLKGFRPGKVPVQVVQRMYGKDILIEEVNTILGAAVSDYIRDNKLQVVGDPIMDRQKADAVDWAKQTEFEFDYDLGLATDFDLDSSQWSAVPSYNILAGGKELEDTLENLQAQFGDQIHAELSEEGDMLYGELSQGEFNTKTAIPFRQINEAVKDKFIGVAKDSTITFDIRETFADDKAIALLTGQKEDEVAGMTGEFEFKIEDITRKGKAEMNQEFFDKTLGLGKVDNEEDFKKEVLDIISENYNRESAAVLSRSVQDEIIEKTKIDLPDEFLKKWLFDINEGKFSMEAIEKDYNGFAQNLRWTLIKNKAADKAGITVEAEEIIAHTEAMVRAQFGMYGQDESMNDTIKRIAMNHLTQDKKTDNYQKIFGEIMDEKIMGHFKTEATLDQKDVDVEEFKAIVEALNKKDEEESATAIAENVETEANQ